MAQERGFISEGPNQTISTLGQTIFSKFKISKALSSSLLMFSVWSGHLDAVNQLLLQAVITKSQLAHNLFD